jgi:hypothetical protein
MRKQTSAAILQDGRRRHLENRLPAVERAILARFW